MAYHNRILLQGKTYSGEVWSSGFSAADVTIPIDNGIVENYGDLSEWAQDIHDYWAGRTLNNLLGPISSTGTIERVRVEARNGQTLIQAAESTGGPIPGSNPPTMPAQVSLVLSLLTGRPGRSYRGRMYWPGLWLDLVGSTGRINGTLVDAIAGDAKTMLNSHCAFANAIVGGGSDIRPVVYSTKLNSVTPVTAVSVGNVPDTQRRRRDRLVENYTTVGL